MFILANLPVDFQVLYWGILISMALFGITILQAWTYMITNFDRMYLRILVAILVALDFCTTVLTGHIGYYTFVENFGNVDQILLLEISAPLNHFASLAIMVLIQAFFASRVAMLHKGKIAPILIVFFALGSAVAGTLAGIHEIIDPSIFSFATYIFRVYAGMFMGFAVLSDLITTFYLIQTFYDMKSTSSRTDQILNRLIDFVVRRGILVTTAQMTTLILYLVQPTRLYWSPAYFLTSKTHVITMIAMLNGREDMKRHDDDVVQFSTLRVREFSSESALATSQSGGTRPSLIHFQTSSTNQDSSV